MHTTTTTTTTTLPLTVQAQSMLRALQGGDAVFASDLARALQARHAQSTHDGTHDGTVRALDHDDVASVLGAEMPSCRHDIHTTKRAATTRRPGAVRSAFVVDIPSMRVVRVARGSVDGAARDRPTTGG
jgi:hypothetical protein